MTTLPLFSLTPEVLSDPLIVSWLTSILGTFVRSFIVPLAEDSPDENSRCLMLPVCSLLGGRSGAFVIAGEAPEIDSLSCCLVAGTDRGGGAMLGGPVTSCGGVKSFEGGGGAFGTADGSGGAEIGGDIGGDDGMENSLSGWPAFVAPGEGWI